MMKKINPSKHAEVMLQIMHLKAEKFEQETKLKTQFYELLEEYKPISVLKRSLNEITADQNVQTDLMKAGMGLTTKFIISRVFKKQETIKSFLSAVILEKISTVMINKNATGILESVSKFIRPRHHQSEGENESESEGE